MTAPGPLSLAPAMGTSTVAVCAGGRWVSSLDIAVLSTLPARIPLHGSDGYETARFLIRRDLDIIGFVEVPIIGAAVSASDLIAEVAGLASAPAAEPAPPRPPMTVAVTTRNRPQNIAPLLDSLCALDYPEFEILIVDNASDDDRTIEAVEAYGDARVRVVREVRPGASRGRNRALLEAKYDLVAFTDDDVVADPTWLNGVARGFSRGEDVKLVTGMVPSGELATVAQLYFERRINWEVAPASRTFRLSDPPSEIPLFPFEVGYYGTGANFAIDRRAAHAIGGLNEALGTGSPSGGGEDIDLFVRILYAGYALTYEPSSVVWHRHRRDAEALSSQMTTYGRGMGAWIASVLASRATRGDAIRLILRALRRVRAVGRSADSASADDTSSARAASVAAPPLIDPANIVNPSKLRRVEVFGMVAGPAYYARARLQGRVTRPLTAMSPVAAVDESRP